MSSDACHVTGHQEWRHALRVRGCLVRHRISVSSCKLRSVDRRHAGME